MFGRHPSFPKANPEPQGSPLTSVRPPPLAARGDLEIQVPVRTAGGGEAGGGAAGAWGEGRAISDEALQAQSQKRPHSHACRKQHSGHHRKATGGGPLGPGLWAGARETCPEGSSTGVSPLVGQGAQSAD